MSPNGATHPKARLLVASRKSRSQWVAPNGGGTGKWVAMNGERSNLTNRAIPAIVCRIPYRLSLSAMRSIITTLLCVLPLLGQSAALWHVGTCGSHQNATAVNIVAKSSPSTDDLVHRASCGHHHACTSSDQPTSSDHGLPAHDHDSDRCALCHWLASAAGLTLTKGPSLLAIVPTDNALLASSPAFKAPSLKLQRLRGPPLG